MDEEVRSILEYVVGYAAARGVELAEFRIEKRRSTRIELIDGSLTSNTAIDYGVAVRVYVNGSFGFAYTTRLTKDKIIEAFNKALALARGASAGLPKPLTFDPAEGDYIHPVKVSVEDVPVEQKVSDIVGFDKLLAREPVVKSRTVVYNDIVEDKYYASTEERFLHEKRELVYLYASIYGQEAGVRGSAHIVLGTIKGYTLWEKYDPEKEASRLIRRLRNQFEAATPKAGVFPVILAPEALGVFVHEAFGHLAEADLVTAGSILRGRKGEKVASELVTIVDDPYIDDGFGTIRFDDEGVKTAKAVIVEKGIHKQVMTDRLHAAMLDEDPTGNARAQSFRHPPLVRMRNTYMERGDASLEEMLEGIRFGYYIVSTGGGQTNIDGSFQVGVEEAYEIVNGELGKPVRNLGIAGNTLETLLNIDMVGKDFELHYGRCGKGQLVYVSDGGPHVRVKKMTVGGRE
jgi:TldD protein